MSVMATKYSRNVKEGRRVLPLQIPSQYSVVCWMSPTREIYCQFSPSNFLKKHKLCSIMVEITMLLSCFAGVTVLDDVSGCPM